MSSITCRTLLAALTGAAAVAAHGHVNNLIINGVQWAGFDPTTYPYLSDPPPVVGWSTSVTDDGFVAPNAFGSGDIICHRDATNAGGHAVVAAGDKVFIQWNTWSSTHKGPVIDYMANCGPQGCETVDKASLNFFKIDEVGLVDGNVIPGIWGADQLIANNNSWLVEIPPNIEPGFYVLRHEIISLHQAGTENGAQAYPQCFNLQVTGSGTETPVGVPGTSLYSAADPGILMNIYQFLSTYDMPGPTMYSGAVHVALETSVATATATAVTGTETGGAASATDTIDAQATSATIASSSFTAAPLATPTEATTSTTAIIPTSIGTTTDSAMTTNASTISVTAESTELPQATDEVDPSLSNPVSPSQTETVSAPSETGGSCSARHTRRMAERERHARRTAEQERRHARDVRLS